MIFPAPVFIATYKLYCNNNTPSAIVGFQDLEACAYQAHMHGAYNYKAPIYKESHAHNIRQG